MGYHFIPIKTSTIKNTRSNSVGEDVDKRKPLFTIDGNVDWCCHYGKQFGDSSENQS